MNQMNQNEIQEQEDDRGHREWAEVQEKLEQAAHEEATRLVAQAQPILGLMEHFVLRVFK